MNEDQELPEDAVRNVENVPDNESRAELERLLKSARPRPPRLDLAVIERLAREAPAHADVSSLEESPTVLLKPRTPWRGQRNRPYAAMVGSWFCGALVGAICMFWYEGSAAPANGRNTPTVQVAEDPSRAVITDRNTTPKSASGQLAANASVAPSDTYAALSDADSLVFAVLLDLNRSIGSRNERPGGTLRARMPPSSLAENSWRDAGEVHIQGDASKDDVRTPPEGLMPDQDTLRQSPPITRERLLRELLGDTARRYL